MWGDPDSSRTGRDLAKDRPSWIDAAPTYDGEELKVAVLGGPFVSTRACEKQLGEEVEKTVALFV